MGRRGSAESRGEEFRLAAEMDILGKTDGAIPFDPFKPPVDRPPEVAFQHGVAVGMPGERITGQAILDTRLANLISTPRRRLDD